jgi:hypothetical protein
VTAEEIKIEEKEKVIELTSDGKGCRQGSAFHACKGKGNPVTGPGGPIR